MLEEDVFSKMFLLLYIHNRHCCVQVHQLYVVLRKKKDPVSHTSYLDAIAQVRVFVLSFFLHS